MAVWIFVMVKKAWRQNSIRFDSSCDGLHPRHRSRLRRRVGPQEDGHHPRRTQPAGPSEDPEGSW